jgi:hypothetical protein
LAHGVKVLRFNCINLLRFAIGEMLSMLERMINMLEIEDMGVRVKLGKHAYG